MIAVRALAEGGPAFLELAKGLRNRLENVLDSLKASGKYNLGPAQELNQRYLAAVAAHHDLLDSPSEQGLGSLQQAVDAFEKSAQPYIATNQGLAGGGTPEQPADPYAAQLSQIASEMPSGSSSQGIDWLVNAAMMRLGYMPPSYAMYNPPPSFAEGGSLSEIAEGAREFGGPQHREDRARIATRVAQQLYGVDQHGNPVLLGGIAHRGATPPGIVDEALSIPHSGVQLMHMLKDLGGPPSVVDKLDPQWSRDAAGRLSELNRAVQKSTGVGEPNTLTGAIEDIGASVGTPTMLGKLGEKGSLIRRLMNNTAMWQGSDAAQDPGLKLQQLRAKLTASPPQQADPQIVQAAEDQTGE